MAGIAGHVGRTPGDHRSRCQLDIIRALTRGTTVIPVLARGPGLPCEPDLPEDLNLRVDCHDAAFSIKRFRMRWPGGSRVPDH